MSNHSASIVAAQLRNSTRGTFSTDVRFNLKLVITIAFIAIVFGLILPKGVE